MSNTSNLDFHHHLLDLAEAMRPLPTTVVRLASVIADENSHITEVTSILREDPSLVAALLRESNSAASAPGTGIVTVEAAIMRLGLARVLAIATSTALSISETQQPLYAYGLPAGRLWDHSIKASYVAEAIYRKMPRMVGAEVVTAALLHDIGQIVLDKVLDPRHFQLARTNNLLVTTAERELVEVDHAELGALLLELWDIPRSITDAVRYHHEPQLGVGHMAHVTFVANLIAHDFDDVVTDRTAELDALLEASLVELGLDLDEVLNLSTRILERAGLIEEPSAELT
jgi:putative nucleotidyltransferase with HDIG domain